MVIGAEMGEHARMSNPLLELREVAGSPAGFVAAAGEVFARFGAQTQDSGNVSYGVRVARERFFVKTTDPDASVYLPHADRVVLLRNAVALNTGFTHPLMPRLLNVIESEAGPMLVYQWVDGELLRAVPGDSDSAHERFRRLPVREIKSALDGLLGLHRLLADEGYVAVDFYDGCLLYDFAEHALHVVDLDHYHHGPFTNEMGRMFGSSRFMAPEEFELGAQIDERTTVFNLGRAVAIFLGDGSLDAGAFRGSPAQFEFVLQACQPDPAARHQSLSAAVEAWLSTR